MKTHIIYLKVFHIRSLCQRTLTHHPIFVDKFASKVHQINKFLLLVIGNIYESQQYKSPVPQGFFYNSSIQDMVQW